MISIGIGTFMVILAVVGGLVALIGFRAAEATDGPDGGWLLMGILGGLAMALGLIGMATMAVTADFAIARIDELMRQFPFLRAP